MKKVILIFVLCFLLVGSAATAGNVYLIKTLPKYAIVCETAFEMATVAKAMINNKDTSYLASLMQKGYVIILKKDVEVYIHSFEIVNGVKLANISLVKVADVKVWTVAAYFLADPRNSY